MARAAAVAPARHVEPARPDLTVVQRRRARRSMMTKLGVLAFAALFASVLGVVVFQTLRAQNQTTLDELNRQVAAEQDRGKSLRLQLADAESPDRIAKAAEDRLGMIAPGDVAYLQPNADDDAKAAWDPLKDPVPTAAPAATAPPVTTPPATLAYTAPSTARTPVTSVPTIKAPTTPTTKSPSTTPSTTKPSSPTTTARPTVTTTPGKPK